MGLDGQDAVAFLEEQHEQARGLLSQVASGAADRREAFDALVRLLAVHETAEEMIVYPAVRASVPGGNDLVDARLEEEDQAKKLLSALEKLGVDGDGFDQQFASFAQAVNDHAEHEEREVFPRLRSHLEPETLASMRSGLVAAEAAAPTHPHPHAPESAIGNLVVGPFAMIVDRVRDAVRALTR